jgi:hypothetical protein
MPRSDWRFRVARNQNPSLRRVISISQIVVPMRAENGSWEVWASADANYDEAKSQLEVKLDSFLRRSSDDKRLTPNWLPSSQTVLSWSPLRREGHWRRGCLSIGSGASIERFSPGD